MDLDLDSQQVPLSSASFDNYQSKLEGAALTATKRAFVLPHDIQFHRTLDKSFAAEIDAISARVFSLTDKLLRYAQGPSAKGKTRAILRTEDDLVEGYHSSVIDIVDQLHENADKALDKLSGRGQHAIPVPEAGPSTSKQPSKKAPALDPSLLHAVNLSKPQLRFTQPVDNLSPWLRAVSKRRQGPIVELGSRQPHFELGPDDPRNQHPYLLETLHIQYPSLLFHREDPIPPRSYNETPFTWITSPTNLSSLLEKLRNSKEIAVDLEYHSLRSYYGFVCLMQISTRQEDFIIDTLALREELKVLNQVFTDPSIVKVFHGAESDIIWLQQDFNLYIVNLFDTYQASLLLGGFPKHGLGSLLSYFCGFEADKRYQLADWRIRPLPQEMLYYARSDTHFLLFIYDNVRNLLLNRADDAEFLQKALDASSRTSLQVYNREMYDVEEGSGLNGWRAFLAKFSNQGAVGIEADRRTAVVVAVHVWRDCVARELDESPAYVLPSNAIFRLANAPNPPTDLPSLFKIVPLTAIRNRAQELLDVLTTAKMPVSLAEASLAIRRPEIKNGPLHVRDGSNGSLMPDLWGTSRSSASGAMAQHSELWRHLSFETAASSTIAAPSSSLFGLSKSSQGPVTSDNASAHPKYNEIIRRIHSTLVVAPTLASPPTIPEPPPTPPPPDADVLTMPAEIPFVPAGQRMTLTPSATVAASTQSKPLTGDTVVVGRKKSKKANKLRQPPPSQENSRSTASGSGKGDLQDQAPVDDSQKGQEEEITAFDFSSIPNMLDDDDETSTPVATQKLTKKQKARDRGNRSKGSAASPYGNFPAPPRNRAEARSGNISHTFK